MSAVRALFIRLGAERTPEGRSLRLLWIDIAIFADKVDALGDDAMMLWNERIMIALSENAPTCQQFSYFLGGSLSPRVGLVSRSVAGSSGCAQLYRR